MDVARRSGCCGGRLMDFLLAALVLGWRRRANFENFSFF
jgi:hypothetical protein